MHTIFYKNTKTLTQIGDILTSVSLQNPYESGFPDVSFGKIFA